MKPRTIAIFVNGILNFPGEGDGWTGRAATHTNLNSAWTGEKFEYTCFPLTRRIHQQRRARKLATMIEYYCRAGWEVHVIVHSNGGDILLRSLDILSGKPFSWVIESLHFISAACEADFEKNGLNELYDEDKVKRIYVYLGKKDLPLRIAHWTREHLLKWFGLGYGSLGYTGPINQTPGMHGDVIERAEFGHSSWFENRNFPDTMQMVLEQVRSTEQTTLIRKPN